MKVNLTYLQNGSIAAIAQESIEAGLVVENCPVLRLSWRSKYHNDPTIVNYFFKDPCNDIECVNHGNSLFVPLGWGLFYSQSDNPNCNVYLSEDFKTLVIQANKLIKSGELITINRNNIISLVNNVQSSQSVQSFSSEDLEDDESFMKKMAVLLEQQNNS